MPSIIVADAAGQETVLQGRIGQTVMEVVRDAGFAELLALCGGCCSCATCHVHIDEGFADALPEMTGDENDLLDSSSHRGVRSRLSCQLPITDALDGLRLTIAAED